MHPLVLCDFSHIQNFMQSISFNCICNYLIHLFRQHRKLNFQRCTFFPQHSVFQFNYHFLKGYYYGTERSSTNPSNCPASSKSTRPCDRSRCYSGAEHGFVYDQQLQHNHPTTNRLCWLICVIGSKRPDANQEAQRYICRCDFEECAHTVGFFVKIRKE